MTWNPDQYNRFRAERMAPFEDLIRWLRVRPGLSGVDLGCGTGELTRRLAELLPECKLLGIDSSEEMLPRTEGFQLGRIQDFRAEQDLIFSHAALHWVDDHPALFRHLWSCLKPDGQLLVQMPYNFDHPSHLAAAEVAASLGQQPLKRPVLPVEEYARLLWELGAQDFQVVLKVYPHVLENADAIVEWTRGTLLTAYQLSDKFLELYREAVRQACPGSPVFYGFKRLLLTASKPA
ncbi:MAG: methyltransferase domain-containing protein [Vulcanimicrobiota bacterium]